MSLPDPPTGTVRIVIDFNGQTGEIGLVGPIEQPTLFLGMLETAKMVLLEQRAKKEREENMPRVLTAPPGFDPQIIGH